MVSPMIAVWSVFSRSSLRAARIMSGLGLAHAKGPAARGRLEHGDHGAATGAQAACVGQFGSRLVAISWRPPPLDHPNGPSRSARG